MGGGLISLIGNIALPDTQHKSNIMDTDYGKPEDMQRGIKLFVKTEDTNIIQKYSKKPKRTLSWPR
jgi:hypothetical protein